MLIVWRLDGEHKDVGAKYFTEDRPQARIFRLLFSLVLYVHNVFVRTVRTVFVHTSTVVLHIHTY